MHIAAYCDSLEAFIFLQNKGLPINKQSANSYLPIHYACLAGSYEVVEYILSVDPSQATVLPQVEYHLIYLATMSGDPDVLRLLFKNGADINAAQNKKNKSVQQAIKTRHVECLRILLEKGSKNEVDKEQYSTLMLAIANNEFDAVPLLAESGENLEYVVPGTGETALSLACFVGHRLTVKYLCDHMTKVDIDPSFRTKAAVHWVCQSKDPEIVKMVLAKNINVNRLDQDGHTGLFYLLDLTDEDNTIKIIELLYNAGLDLNIQGKSVTGAEVNSILGDFVSSIHRPTKVIGYLLQNGARADAKLISQNKRIIDFVQNSRNRKLSEVFKKWVPELFKQTGRSGRTQIKK